MILYAVIENPLVLDNPLVTFVLGTFAPIVMMVYTFYYRKNKTKPEWDERLDSSCPCCGKDNLDQLIKQFKINKFILVYVIHKSIG